MINKTFQSLEFMILKKLRIWKPGKTRVAWHKLEMMETHDAVWFTKTDPKLACMAMKPTQNLIKKP